MKERVQKVVTRNVSEKEEKSKKKVEPLANTREYRRRLAIKRAGKAGKGWRRPQDNEGNGEEQRAEEGVLDKRGENERNMGSGDKKHGGVSIICRVDEAAMIIPAKNSVFADPDGQVQMFEGTVARELFLFPKIAGMAFSRGNVVLDDICTIAGFRTLEITGVSDSHIAVAATMWYPGSDGLGAFENIMAIVHAVFDNEAPGGLPVVIQRIHNDATILFNMMDDKDVMLNNVKFGGMDSV